MIGESIPVAPFVEELGVRVPALTDTQRVTEMLVIIKVVDLEGDGPPDLRVGGHKGNDWIQLRGLHAACGELFLSERFDDE